MKTTSALMLMAALAGCSTMNQNSAQPVGRFVQAGPVSAEATVVSVKWQYGFQFSIDPKSVTEIKLSCSPIPASTFSVKGADVKASPNGVAFWEGDTIALSSESAQWLMDTSSTTTATCQAIVSRAGQPDIVEKAPVRFTPAHKAATVEQMKFAHNWNSSLRKK